MTTNIHGGAIRGAVSLLVAAAIVFVLGNSGFGPSTRLFVVFAAATVVLFGGWYVFSLPRYLFVGWLATATVTAVMVLSGDASPSELRTVGIALAGSGVVSVVTWPTTGYFAELGESVGSRLTDDS
jgi:hypothetical protein